MLLLIACFVDPFDNTHKRKGESSLGDIPSKPSHPLFAGHKTSISLHMPDFTWVLLLTQGRLPQQGTSIGHLVQTCRIHRENLLDQMVQHSLDLVARTRGGDVKHVRVGIPK